MAITMFILSPATVILNAVTIHVFWKEKRMQTIADILLCLLTITDIIAGLVAMPSFAAESILRALNTECSCSIFLTRKLLGFFSEDITLVTSIFIALDRYCSIFQHYRYEAIKYRTGLLIFVVLLAWCVCSAVFLLSIITFRFLLAIVFIASAEISFVLLSIWVHLKILICARKIQQKIAINRRQFDRDKSDMKSWHQIKGARITVVIFAAIFLCYAPQIITGIFMQKFNYSRSSLIAFYWTTCLVLVNSFVNPFVYIWQMKWFRKALWKITLKQEVLVTDDASVKEWHMHEYRSTKNMIKVCSFGFGRFTSQI